MPPPASMVKFEREDRADRLRRSVCVTRRPEGLEKCFTCVGKALSLPSDDQNIDTLFQDFYNANEAAPGFRHMYLSKDSSGAQDSVCPVSIPQIVLDKKNTLVELYLYRSRLEGLVLPNT